MKKTFIILSIILSVSACDQIREKRLKFHFNQTNDTLLIQSFHFLQENMPEKQWKYLLAQDDFLIRDIERAVMSCRDSLQNGAIPMDVFLEYVLPLQVFSEPIENWREDCVQTYAYLKGKHTANICERINWDFSDRFRYGERISPLPKSWSELKAMKKGDCYDMAQAPVYPLRALGFPATIDFIYGWGNANGAHAWNVVYISGKMRPFMGIEEGPETYNPFYVYDYFPDPSRSGYRYPAKIYRKTPVVNQEIIDLRNGLEEDQLPDFLKDYKTKDVTAEYFPVSPVSFEYPQRSSQSENIYLSIYNANQWKPIAGSRIAESGEAFFKDMKRHMLYLPSSFESWQTIPLDYPFILSDDSNLLRLYPDSTVTQDLDVHFLQPILLDYLDGKANQDKLPVNALIQISARDHYRKTVVDRVTYQLYIWKKEGWQLYQENMAGQGHVAFRQIPVNALFHLAEHNGKFIGRPFTVENKNTIWW